MLEMFQNVPTHSYHRIAVLNAVMQKTTGVSIHGKLTAQFRFEPREPYRTHSQIIKLFEIKEGLKKINRFKRLKHKFSIPFSKKYSPPPSPSKH